MTLGL